MSMQELKVWQPTCDGCRRSGPTMFSKYQPGPPDEWGYETHHDCGLTGYTAHRLYCGECLQDRKKNREQAAATPRNHAQGAGA